MMEYGSWLIAKERARQQTAHDYTPEHDDDHVNGELAIAAQTYIIEALEPGEGKATGFWPWEEGWNPSTDPVRNLVKAGALIAAEIDRLNRVAEFAGTGGEDA